MAKSKDLKKISERELFKTLNDRRKDLKDFKFSIWGSKTRDTKEGRAIRKKIARVMTEIRRREIEDSVI